MATDNSSFRQGITTDTVARRASEGAGAFVTSGEAPNCVNLARRTPARCTLIVRHHDRVGVLANVLGEIRQAGINAQAIENTIFEGAMAACCKIQLDQVPGADLLERIRGRADEVIFCDMVELG